MGKGSLDSSRVARVQREQTPHPQEKTRIEHWEEPAVRLGECSTRIYSEISRSSQSSVCMSSLSLKPAAEWVMDIPDSSRDALSPASSSAGWQRCTMERMYSKTWTRAHTGFRVYAAGTSLGSEMPILQAFKRSPKDGGGYWISAFPGPDVRHTHCATLKWNLLRTEFRLQSRWCECCDPGANTFSGEATTSGCRQDLAAIIYERNWRGDAPRKLAVALPPMDRRLPHRAAALCPVQGHPPLADSLRDHQVRLQQLLHLTNLQPAWNGAIQRHEMSFSSRVTVPSVHNFQLVAAQQPSHKLLEFGKMGKGLYMLDYRYPMSLAQAAACALSSFEASSLCT